MKTNETKSMRLTRILADSGLRFDDAVVLGGAFMVYTRSQVDALLIAAFHRQVGLRGVAVTPKDDGSFVASGWVR